MAHSNGTFNHNDHCPDCALGTFVRNHYFTGKLLVERDFTEEQRYHIDKLRHHHQRLHGWGVVCGLKVKQHPSNPAQCLIVEPGTAIDCCGHEILVREEVRFPFAQAAAVKALTDAEKLHTLQICIRYKECSTEEIPVLFDECGCDETRCAPNRILESYELDVLVDPKKEPTHEPNKLRLQWKNTIALAHSARVALSESAKRLYVMSSDTPAVIHAVSTDNHAVMPSPHKVPAQGLALAVSNDGKQVYAAVPNGASDVDVLVLDAANPAAAPARTLTIAGAGGAGVVLVVAPDGRLLALFEKSKTVAVWGTDINDPTITTPGPEKTVTLSADVHGLVLSTDGKRAYTADGAAHAIRAIDTTAVSLVSSDDITLDSTAKPSVLAVAQSTAGDTLVAGDASNDRLYFVPLGVVSPTISSARVTHHPVALAVSPGGKWVYALESDGATPESFFIEPVNANRVRLKLPDVLGALVPVEQSATQLALTKSGKTLYLPYPGDAAAPDDGGVAIFDVTEEGCAELLWQGLDGCPSCDSANCVVLATVENYHAGDKLEDQTDPPAKPEDDLAAHIARIDNRKSRRLLPSTQVLTEVIRCILEHGTGGEGKQGPPGLPGPGIDAVTATFPDCTNPGSAQIQTIGIQRTLVLEIPRGCDGQPGQAGSGLDEVNLRLVPCGQAAMGKIETGPSGARTLVLQIPSGCDTNLTHVCAINWVHPKPPIDDRTNDTSLAALDRGVLIAFDRLVRSGDIHRHSFSVLAAHQDENSRTICWCELLPKLISGVRFASTCKISEFETVSDAGAWVNGALFLPADRFRPNTEYRVILKGDLILDEKGKAVDANHLPNWLSAEPSGDGVEGGTFESWFRTARD